MFSMLCNILQFQFPTFNQPCKRYINKKKNQKLKMEKKHQLIWKLAKKKKKSYVKYEKITKYM